MYVKNNFEVTLVAKLEQVEVGASHSQRAHWVTSGPNRVSLEPAISPFSLSTDYAEVPGRLRTFPASWYTTTMSKSEKNLIRHFWMKNFENFFEVDAPVFVFPAG